MKLRFFSIGWSLFLCALLAAGGCKQIDLEPGLPDETQEGKNTFGCKVDESLWLPYVEHTLDRKVEAEYRGGWFTMRAEREKDPIEYIRLQLSDPSGSLQVKTYTVKEGFTASFETQTLSQYDLLSVDSTGEGAVTITRVQPVTDTAIGGIVSRYTIVSGRFSFTAVSPTSGKKVEIRDGRFDVQAFQR